jgi:hypothetical protein
MRLGISRTISVLALGSAVIATTSVGVTLAATKASGYKACATSAHVLVLNKSNGKCPAHASAVTLDAHGPRGLQGKQGIQGKQGSAGKNLTAPANVVVVSGAGTPTQNGTVLRNAVDAISGSTATTIELGPGTYDLGTSGLLLSPELRLVGAGTDQTTILGEPSMGTLLEPSAAATIDDLTVRNAATSGAGIGRSAIFVPTGASARIDNVVVDAGTDTIANSAAYGIDVAGQVQITGGEIEGSATTSGSTILKGVEVSAGGILDLDGTRDVVGASGTGDSAFAAFVESNGTGTFVDFGAIAGHTPGAGGVGIQSDGQATVRNSSIDAGTDNALDILGGTLLVANSMISGSATGATCVGDYNSAFVALNTTCH